MFLTAARLATIASELQMFESTLSGEEDAFGSMLTTVSSHVHAADAAWRGPRSSETLTAARQYIGKLQSAPWRWRRRGT